MPAPRRRLLDSYAILALLGDEAGAATVADHLREALATGVQLLVNEVNVGEVYYIVGRYRSLDDAERVLDHLETLPLERCGEQLRRRARRGPGQGIARPLVRGRLRRRDRDPLPGDRGHRGSGVRVG